jgi:hypothetical protein
MADFKKMKNKNILIAIILCFLVVTSAIFFVNTIRFYFTQGFSENVLNDMSIFMGAGRKFIQSGKLYERSENYAEKYGPDTPVYKFPPAYQLTIVPLINSGISESMFLIIQRSLYFFMYLSSAIMMIFINRQLLIKYDNKTCYGYYELFIYTALSALLIFWYAPFHEAFLNLHTEILILFLIVSSFFVLEKHPFLSGATLSLAFSIKIYPVFLLVYYISTRQWRVISGFVLGFILLTFFVIYYFGYGESFFYAHTILPVLINQNPVNHSQNLMIEKFFYTYGIINVMNGHIHLVIKYIALGVLILIAAIKDNTRLKLSPLYFGMFACGTLIWLPNYWLQYQMILFIPIITLLAYALQSRSLLFPALLAGIIIIMCTQNQWYENINTSMIQKARETQLLDYLKNHSNLDSFIHTLISSPALAFMFVASKVINWLCDLQSLIPELLFIISAWILLNSKNDQARLVLSVPPST